MCGFHSIDDLSHRLRDRACRVELSLEAIELCPGRQRTAEQQVRRLLERGVRRQIVDVVAAVDELAFLTINKRDPRVVQNHALQSSTDVAHELSAPIAFRARMKTEVRAVNIRSVNRSDRPLVS